MKKPLIILSQDKEFKKWDEDKRSDEERLEEEKSFFVKRMDDAVEKYVVPHWEKAYAILHGRGLISDEELQELRRKEDRQKGLSVEDGVLFISDKKSSNIPEIIKNLLPI